MTTEGHEDPGGLSQAVLAAIDEDELIGMAQDLINIPSLTGHEAGVSDYLAERFRGLGLKVTQQEVEAGRDNVIGTWTGGDGDESLLFLGHMDHAPGIGVPEAKWVDDEWISGIGASNMKSAFAAYYMATKMLKEAGFQPRGDIHIGGVVGEIEGAPIGHHQGADCRGGGYGARYLASHGYIPDYILNGEPTGLRVQIANGGYIFLRLTTRGVTQHASYRQFGVDAIEKMESILPRIREWEAEYQATFKHDLVVPRINIGAIEGGVPNNPQLVANFCHAYMDVMLVPGTNVLEVKHEIQRLVRRLNEDDPELGLTMEIYMTSRGYEVPHDSLVATTARKMHRLVTDRDPDEPEPARFGVSSDNWIFAESGAESITYGPAGRSRVLPGEYAAYDPDFGEVISVKDLIICAKVYALTVMELMKPNGAR
ncbi:MAG TPA: M20/M25/M40 family metallo-hydrolase [Acidimicrobiia bacterium]|nr:M20/M25/M40 family metallo-hydrolase [Acidimicrobiia bacterium]